MTAAGRTLSNTIRLKGRRAIEYAEKHGLPLCKYHDALYGWRDDLSIAEARLVLQQDPFLIYIDIPRGEERTGE